MTHQRSASIFFRRGGISQQVNHAQCRADANGVAAALRKRGFGPGSRIAIHGATSYEWVLADLACVLTGALSVALYPSAPLTRALATIRESGCRLVFTDRADAATAAVSAGLDVIFLGDRTNAPDGVVSVAELLTTEAETPIAATDPRNGPFTIVSTSGTLSEPKLFAVAAPPLLFTMDRFAEIYGFGAGDRLLLYLPLSHLPQRMMLYWGLREGLDFVLSDPAHFVTDGHTFEPTLHVTVPRVLEHIRWRARKMVPADAPEGPALTQIYQTLFGPRIRSIFVGSAPTDLALMSELLAAGLPVFEVYGTTELGMIGLNTPAARLPGTVGQPIPWGEVRLDRTTREVLVRTPTPFMYGRLVGDRVERWEPDPSAFESTGDVGEFDGQGFLRIIGRIRDFVALPSGEKVFIAPIESALAQRTGADLCHLTLRADGRLAALLFFESRAVPDDRLVLDEIRQANEGLHPWERLKAFAIVDRMPTVEEGCLTETTKPRRHLIDRIHAASAEWRPVAGPAGPGTETE
ncbi:AMP-binding protein [Nocardia sp. NPDC046763]|uniref:AMP-binding protein n=1 Tax=Nocardia sp. NPDC046763 TaxID=3155256 RepID=UPI00340B6444